METKEKLSGRKWHICSSASLSFLYYVPALWHKYIYKWKIYVRILESAILDKMLKSVEHIGSLQFSFLQEEIRGASEGFPGGANGKGWPANAGDLRVWSLDEEDPLEEGAATPSSILAWRIPWTEEPGGLQTTGSQSRTRLKRLSRHAEVCPVVSAGKKKVFDRAWPCGGLDHMHGWPAAYGLALQLLADAWNFLTWDKTSHSPV